jgi:hypothetical protein
MIAKHRLVIDALLKARDDKEIGKGEFFVATNVTDSGTAVDWKPCCVMGHAMHAVGIDRLVQQHGEAAMQDEMFGVPDGYAAEQEWGLVQEAVVECNDMGNFTDAIGLMRTAFEEMSEGIFGMTGHDWDSKEYTWL